MLLDSIFVSSSLGRFHIRNYLPLFFWTTGLISGCILCTGLPESSISLMRALPFTTVSIVCMLLIMCLFPLLISFITIWLNNRSILYVYAYAKAFVFSFTVSGIYNAFSGAGWLLRWLLVFSGSCTSVFTLWLWLNPTTDMQRYLKQAIVYLLFSLLVISIDYFWIRPFVFDLFHHS